MVDRSLFELKNIIRKNGTNILLHFLLSSVDRGGKSKAMIER